MAIKFITNITCKIHDWLYPMKKILRVHQDLKEFNIKRANAGETYAKYYNNNIYPVAHEETELRQSLLTATTKEKEIIESKIDELVERKAALTNSDEYKRIDEAYKKYDEMCNKYIREKLNDEEQKIVSKYGWFSKS